MFTIPNIITLFRFMLIPAFLIMFFSQQVELHLLATAVFLVASLSDWLDGFLARWLQQESELGKHADPLADKMLSVSLFFALLIRDDLAAQLPIAVYCIVIIAIAEGGILLMSTIALYRGVDVEIAFVGKLKTVFQFITILLVLLRLNLVESIEPAPPWLVRVVGWDGVLPLINFGFIAAAALTITALIVYGLRYPRHRDKLRAARSQAKEAARVRRDVRREVRIDKRENRRNRK